MSLPDLAILSPAFFRSCAARCCALDPDLSLFSPFFEDEVGEAVGSGILRSGVELFGGPEDGLGMDLL